MELEKQMPIKQSFCGSLRRDGHWKCFCLTLLIATCLAAISWCKVTNAQKSVLSYMDSPFSNSEELGPCKDGYVYIPVAFVVMLYLVYLVECWHSHSRLELKYKVDIPTVYSTISEMHGALPVIWWKATCYHYVRRTRQVMRYRNGDAFSSTQVYYERVDSRTAGAAFNFTHCGVKDISRPLSELEKYPAIKIKVSKGFSFANVDTEYEFEEQRAQFFQDYETRDDYMEGQEGMDLMNVDFREYMIAFSDPNNLPWYVSHVAFWIASSLLLSWPLRTIIEYKTAHLHYHIHKLFGSNYIDTENYPNLMSRVSTMNSVELEMSIRNNNVIVPSYSEAMLNNAFEMQQIRDYGATKTSSKFPRSLTNVTLAGRSNASFKQSVTPAVTMNRVKRFNSCSTVGATNSTDVLSNSGTIRNQITALIRDRGRMAGKGNALSSVTISGLPDSTNPMASRASIDGVLPSSFSSYSMFVPSRFSATNRSIVDVSRAPTSTCASSSVQDLSRRDGANRKKAHPPFLRASDRTKSVPESNSQHSIGTFQLVTAAKELSNARLTPSHSSTPTPPPPDYEEAVRMYHDVENPSENPSATAGSIGLTLDSRRALNPVNGACASPLVLREGQQNPNSILDPIFTGSVINTTSVTESECCGAAGGSSASSQAQTQQRLTSQTSGLPVTFKVLPQVNPCVYPESDDSDSECLHGPASEMESVDCPPTELRRMLDLSPPPSSRLFPRRSISEEETSPSFQDCTPLTLIHQHSAGDSFGAGGDEDEGGGGGGSRQDDGNSNRSSRLETSV